MRRRILALYADGAATARQAGAALVCRARILARLVQDAPDEAAAESALAGLEQGARELLAFTEPLRGEPGVATRAAEALDLLGDVAAFRGDPHGALERYERTAAETDGAGLSWNAVEYLAKASGLAAQLEEYGRAEGAARATLEHRSTGPIPTRRRSRRTHGPGSCGASWAMSRRWYGRCGCEPGSRSGRGSRARRRRGRTWRQPSGSTRKRWPPPRRTGRPGCSRNSRTPTAGPAS
ncbi:hypothetical protein ACFU98_23905 [Streptomyces sp. NPDC057575]|uniref:hypothetical protein n=1 Tax=unclassified Streptomyces TaxID=2593676 RepID=UPI00368CAFF6